jgi:hypothetical protein
MVRHAAFSFSWSDSRQSMNWMAYIYVGRPAVRK